MIFEQSVLHKLNMKTSQSRDSDVTGTNCDVIKENLASLSHSDDVIVMYTKIHSLHTSISYNSCGVDERFSLTYVGRQVYYINEFSPNWSSIFYSDDFFAKLTNFHLDNKCSFLWWIYHNMNLYHINESSSTFNTVINLHHSDKLPWHQLICK